MNFSVINADIKTAPQGYTMLSSFSDDLNCDVGISNVMNEMFDIKNRTDVVKRFKSGNLAKLDNLYMLLVRKTSYDSVDVDRFKDALTEFAAKCEKNKIKKVAMPATCTGKNGISLGYLYEMLDDIFELLDVNIIMYVPEK